MHNDDNLKKRALGMLSDKRRLHTEGVRKTAKELCEIYGADAGNIAEDHIVTDHFVDHLVADFRVQREQLPGKFVELEISDRSQDICGLNIAG